MATTTALLNQPVDALGEPRSYFFNGRLLSAEDLTREQDQRAGGQRRLARLIGCGVAKGLQVSRLSTASKLRIAPGLGVTPSGELIEIDQLDLDLSAAARAGRLGGFGNCAAGLADGQPLAGLYLLVLTPAWTPQGRAQTLLGEVGACNRRTEQPAVRARLLELLRPASATNVNLRNLLAVGLLSPGQGLAATSADERVGWWPRLRQRSDTGASCPTLGGDDLPLSVVQIDSSAGVVFLDTDAARRPLALPPGAAGDALWPLSWAVEMQAFGVQFLAQLGATLPPPASEFVWLPPALTLSPAQLERFAQVFRVKLSARIPALGRAAFARALQDGWLDEPVAHQSASWQVFRLIGHAERLLLRIQSTVTEADTLPRKPGEAFGERTSAGVASAASRLLAAGRRAKAHPNEGQSPSKAELSVAASALTQAPDRPKRLPKS